jgi:hypothetical protein
MAVSSIGASAGAVSKAAPAKPVHPPAKSSTQPAPAASHKNRQPQVGQQGHRVNKLV